MPHHDRFRDEVARVQAEHPAVELYVVWSGPGEPVLLHFIRTSPAMRGQGLAEAALRDVLALADEWRLPVRLTAEPVTGDTDTDLARLIAWYERHGFAILGAARPDEDAVIMQRPARGK
ncbi:GNAT family N-acetyltransferase [Spirillospora sp. CA-255316]